MKQLSNVMLADIFSRFANSLNSGAAIGSGDQVKKLTETTMYITGNGLLAQGRLIDANTRPAPGVTNFPSGNKLPKGAYLVVFALRMSFDKTTGAGVEGKTGNYKDAPVPAIANGELRIAQGTEVFASPVSDVCNSKASTGNDDDFRAIVPFKLRDEANFDIALLLADGAAYPATTAWKLELRCLVVTEPANS